MVSRGKKSLADFSCFTFCGVFSECRSGSLELSGGTSALPGRARTQLCETKPPEDAELTPA